MSTNAEPPTGPDFGKGVAVSQLGEGEMLAGHVAGEAAILTRWQGRLHAVGARCPHYGAPLEKGMIVDGAIRCPWHHAAFELDTGKAERPPALSDLPCWKVEEKGGIARVSGRKPPARRRQAQQSAPRSVVIVGGGGAGVSAAATLRREGFDGSITIVSSERTVPADRPNLSKDYLAGSAEDDWIPLRPQGWYEEHAIRLLTGSRVISLGERDRRAVLEDGSTLEWDALLLATGAEPIRLPLGDSAPVHYLRSWDDSRAIVRRAEDAARAVVLGASFIGLEVAAALRTRGMAVIVVAPETQPLDRVLGAELGGVVRELHERHGVAFRLGRTAKAADDTGVVLDDGTRVPGDLIVAGVGVRPNLSLAESAGLTIDRGVMVNEFLETSAPRIWAAGDIARWPDPHSGTDIRVEHWVVAERQGQTAARNILGAQQRFDAVPFFWSAHYDATIAYVGHAQRFDHMEIDGDPAAHDCTVRYFDRGRMAAVATMGRDRQNLAAEAEMERAVYATSGVGAA